ncbi:hypothetical protein BRC19_02820 [Candidatus Saccharibacteria bacterium QS_5_54_17]|nr:MAG: hypothetical protein BRC19_02820 [Candidatus Saccharibacteria bacterium QS_5_54_17]
MSQVGPFQLIKGPNLFELVFAYMGAFDAMNRTVRMCTSEGLVYELCIYGLAHKDSTGYCHEFKARVVSIGVDPTNVESKEYWVTFPTTPWDLVEGYFDTEARRGSLKFV